MQLTDYQIIEECLNGKHEYFEELVVRYKRLIFSVIYKFFKNSQDISDISQEAFVRIYSNLRKYNPQFKFSTWSVKITTNLCLDAMRKKKIDSIPFEEIEALSVNKDTPEHQYLVREEKELLKKAINSLPEKYRSPVILFHEKGLSYEQIMKILNEPMTIVKNRLYRARLLLREKLTLTGKEETL